MAIKIGCIWHPVPVGYKGIYCGRPGKGKKGPYGNPFSKVSTTNPILTPELWLNKNKHTINSLKLLHKSGANLFLQCFCKKVIDNDTPCHCDNIKEALSQDKEI